ncbi:MAG: hypothetical protein NT154_12215 [Verrucomicrobia bacterium]|nr:hypothetical protein [Verrucomicrobiota bacterium]
MKNLLVGLAGAAAGGVVGYFAFLWIARQGFYALMLPGGLAGVGAGLFVSDRSVLRGILCGVFALGLGLLAEWRFAPFIKDPGLVYFLAHLNQLQPITLLMIAGGGFLGYWLALGRERGIGSGEGTNRV